jgi:hypothetical protein
MAVMASDITGLLPLAGSQIEGFARPVLMVLACFAAADVLLVRFQHTRSIRMTRQQVRLENRDNDGDPFIKAKLRRIRNQRAKRRMMSKVKKADVVITNPTHYAVALTYQRGSKAAPRVVAKGADLVAARIRDEATAHGVPIPGRAGSGDPGRALQGGCRGDRLRLATEGTAAIAGARIMNRRKPGAAYNCKSENKKCSMPRPPSASRSAPSCWTGPTRPDCTSPRTWPGDGRTW